MATKLQRRSVRHQRKPKAKKKHRKSFGKTVFVFAFPRSALRVQSWEQSDVIASVSCRGASAARGHPQKQHFHRGDMMRAVPSGDPRVCRLRMRVSRLQLWFLIMTTWTRKASMTMTSGVGTPFFMAPEMATGTKHYTGAVDVFSFGIMAAQVMVGRLVYDSSDAFETEFGLLFFISLFFTTKPTTLSFSLCLSLVSCCHQKQKTTQPLWMQCAKDFDLVCLVVKPR